MNLDILAWIFLLTFASFFAVPALASLLAPDASYKELWLIGHMTMLALLGFCALVFVIGWSLSRVMA